MLKGASPDQVIRTRPAAKPALAKQRYKLPASEALPQALKVVAAAKDVAHPDS